MDTIPRVATAVAQVLTDAADEAARETGLVRRARKLTGSVLVRLLVWGFLGRPTASLRDLSQVAALDGVIVSPQAIAQRCTPAAAACLAQVLAAAVRQAIRGERRLASLLDRFPAVLVLDSTTVSLPAALAAIWSGCGGRTPGSGAAALKVQVQIDLCTGALTGPELSAGRQQDRAAPLQQTPVAAGALRITDLGYHSLPRFAAIAAEGAFYLSRYHHQTTVFDAAGTRLDLWPWLAAQPPGVIDQSVQVGRAERLHCRLLAVRAPLPVAAERRRKLQAAAQREGQTVSATRHAATDWTIYITNVPADTLSFAEADALYRARWQIELLFKRWKSQLQLASSTSTAPWRVLCEVYAKLLAGIVQHWLTLTAWGPELSRSAWQAATTIRQFAWTLAVVGPTAAPLRAALTTVAGALQAVRPINRRRATPPTWLRLTHPFPFLTTPGGLS